MANAAVPSQQVQRTSEAEATDAQRRKHERFGYPMIQKICVCQGEPVSGSPRFFPVKCKDLSRGGVSFYLDCEPSFSQFIMMISNGDRTEYVAGEVVHVQRLPPDAPEPYLVGCRFVKKVKCRSHADAAATHADAMPEISARQTSCPGG